MLRSQRQGIGEILVHQDEDPAVVVGPDVLVAMHVQNPVDLPVLAAATAQAGGPKNYFGGDGWTDRCFYVSTYAQKMCLSLF